MLPKSKLTVVMSSTWDKTVTPVAVSIFKNVTIDIFVFVLKTNFFVILLGNQEQSRRCCE